MPHNPRHRLQNLPVNAECNAIQQLLYASECCYMHGGSTPPMNSNCCNIFQNLASRWGFNNFTPQWDDWAPELAYDYEMSGQCPTFDMNPPNRCACANTNTQTPQGEGGPTCTSNADCPSYAKCTDGVCVYYHPPIVVTPTSTTGETCPPGTHWMPPSNGQPGYCMEGSAHPTAGGSKNYEQNNLMAGDTDNGNDPYNYTVCGGRCEYGTGWGKVVRICGSFSECKCPSEMHGMPLSFGQCTEKGGGRGSTMSFYYDPYSQGQNQTMGGGSSPGRFNYEQGQGDSTTSGCLPCTQDWGCPGDWSCQGGCCNPRPTIVRPKWYEN